MSEAELTILLERDRYKEQIQMLETNIKVLTKEILLMKDMDRKILQQLQFACAMLVKGIETIDIHDYLLRVIRDLDTK